MAKIGIVGAGLIGRSWAVVFARGGWQVMLTDSDPDAVAAAPARVREAMADLVAHGLGGDVEADAARVATVPSVGAAVVGADLVQECLPEEVAAKRRIFAELDRLAPAGAILASSTSSIVASLFSEGLPGRARCLVAHPVNPPHLVPVVELCGAPWTSPQTIDRARQFYAQVGQVPVAVRQEREGFVLNRLQGALLAEALRLVGEGTVSPQDLDATICEGLGLRWSFMGPFATIDLNAPGGIADYCRRYGGFYRHLAEEPAPPSVWDEVNIARLLEAWGGPPDPARLERLRVRRDARLAALKAHKHRDAVRGGTD